MGTRKEELAQFEREKQMLTNQEKLMEEIRNVQRELIMQRKGDEAFIYGQEVEDNDEVNLDDVEPEEDGE